MAKQNFDKAQEERGNKLFSGAMFNKEDWEKKDVKMHEESMDDMMSMGDIMPDEEVSDQGSLS